MSNERASSPLVVVFVGPPGAGKTTVAERVIAGLRSKGLRVGTRCDFRDMDLRFAASSRQRRYKTLACASYRGWRVLTVAVWRTITASPVRLSHARRSLAFVLLRAAFVQAISSPYDILVFDEWAEPSIVHHTLKCNRPQRITGSLSLMKAMYSGANVAFVCVKGESAIFLERVLQELEKREFSRGRPGGDVVAIMQAYLARYAEIMDTLSQLPGARIETASANAPVEQKADSLTRLILTWLPARSGLPPTYPSAGRVG